MNKQKGYIVLLTVLISGVVATTMATSLLLLGVEASKKTLAKIQSRQARALADACMEEALEQIRESSNFASSGGLTLGEGTCSYTVTNTGGQNRRINTSGTVSAMTRKVKATLSQVKPTLTVTSWQEVAD